MRTCTSNTSRPARISIDESIVKSATQGVSLGVGIRVISGERTGYAYSDDLSPEKIRKAAQRRRLHRQRAVQSGETGLHEGASAQSVSRADRAHRDQLSPSAWNW